MSRNKDLHASNVTAEKDVRMNYGIVSYNHVNYALKCVDFNIYYAYAYQLFTLIIFNSNLYMIGLIFMLLLILFRVI